MCHVEMGGQVVRFQAFRYRLIILYSVYIYTHIIHTYTHIYIYIILYMYIYISTHPIHFRMHIYISLPLVVQLVVTATLLLHTLPPSTIKVLVPHQ